MLVQRQNNAISIELDAYCGIACVEEHTGLFKDVLCADTSVNSLCLLCNQVEEFDTAYLQLLMVVHTHMKNHDGDFIVQNMPPCMTELLDCYGLCL